MLHDAGYIVVLMVNQVRTSTAEDLYLAIQGLETDVDEETEELLLETTWCVLRLQQADEAERDIQECECRRGPRAG